MSEFGEVDPEDMTDEEKQVAARDKALRLRAKAADADIEFVMSTKAGRRFVARLLSASPFDQLSYREGETDDGRGMAFREGKRSACADLVVEVIRVCPNSYWLMTTERTEEN